jgi:hypothetical protein
MAAVLNAWLYQHCLGAFLVWIGTLGLAIFGGTAVMLPLYLISLAVLLYILTSLARLGWANRGTIGLVCFQGLGLVASLSGFPAGSEGVHFVDQHLVLTVLYAGIPLVLFFMSSEIAARMVRSGSQFPRWAIRLLITAVGFLIMLPSVVLLWSASSQTTIQIPSPTPAEIRNLVESFDRAPFQSGSWTNWEIVTTWTIESGMNPDLTLPRQLLESEVTAVRSPQVAPFILGSALRTGVARDEFLDRILASGQAERRNLFEPSYSTYPILSFDQNDWMIRALAQRHELNEDQCDFLEQRLDATIRDRQEYKLLTLGELLHVSQAFAVFGRKLNVDRYRDNMHEWLRLHHFTGGSKYGAAGGFRTYLGVDASSLNDTYFAVELMHIYGIPDGLDTNLIRSYLQSFGHSIVPDSDIAAATLDRLERLPGIQLPPKIESPTIMEIFYHERNLIMAVLLVVICCYATWSVPPLQR